MSCRQRQLELTAVLDLFRCFLAALVLSDINSEAESFNKVFARFRAEILKASSPEIKSAINKLALDVSFCSQMKPPGDAE